MQIEQNNQFKESGILSTRGQPDRLQSIFYRQEGERVSFVSFSKTNDFDKRQQLTSTVTICRMHVCTDMQLKGIGRGLIMTLREMYPKFAICVRTPSSPAKTFYWKVGFRKAIEVYRRAASSNNFSGPGGSSARHRGHTCFMPNDRSPSTHDAWKVWAQGRVQTVPEAKGSRQMAHSSGPCSPGLVVARAPCCAA